MLKRVISSHRLRGIINLYRVTRDGSPATKLLVYSPYFSAGGSYGYNIYHVSVSV